MLTDIKYHIPKQTLHLTNVPTHLRVYGLPDDEHNGKWEYIGSGCARAVYRDPTSTYVAKLCKKGGWRDDNQEQMEAEIAIGHWLEDNPDHETARLFAPLLGYSRDKQVTVQRFIQGRPPDWQDWGHSDERQDCGRGRLGIQLKQAGWRPGLGVSTYDLHEDNVVINTTTGDPVIIDPGFLVPPVIRPSVITLLRGLVQQS